MEVAVRGGIIVGITNVVDAAAAELVVGFFDVGAALVSRLFAVELANWSGAVGFAARIYLGEAAYIGHETGKLHIIVDGLVDKLDAVGVVLSELGIVGSLGIQVENSVANAKGIES